MSLRFNSVSSLRTQGPIRRADRVGRCCCGYGSPPARGRPLVSGGRGNQYLCRPYGRRDPYAVPLVLEMLLNVFGAKLLPVVMGPRLRGGDGGGWLSRQSISMSSLRTQGPIRRAARVGDAVECLWRKTTPCGYGSPPARGRPLVSGVKANCFNRHCERSEAIHREAKQKAGLLRCARNDGGRSVTHVRVLAARMRPRCARISAVPMGRAWGMPGADAPAASHAK